MATLRIKKVYFDQILEGTKTVEWRSFTPFYQRIFSRQPTRLRLHYQQPRVLEADILRIDVVDKPESMRDSPWVTTDRVFKISIANAQLIEGVVNV